MYIIITGIGIGSIANDNFIFGVISLLGTTYLGYIIFDAWMKGELKIE